MLTKEWKIQQTAVTQQNSLYYDWEHCEDMGRADGIWLQIVPCMEAVRIRVILYPLDSGRPEFIEKTEAGLLIPPMTGQIEIPFAFFSYNHSFDAHMKYISHMEVILEKGTVKELWIQRAGLYQKGSLQFQCMQTSILGKTGETLRYVLSCNNQTEQKHFLSIRRILRGREMLAAEYEREVTLCAKEKRKIEISVQMCPELPEGGAEKLEFYILPDYRERDAQQITLYAVKKLSHPYLLHTEERWERLRQAIEGRSALRRQFEQEYLKAADDFQIPERGKGLEYVHESATQDSFLKTAIAWKITGREEYFVKAAGYMEQFADEKTGYLSTKKSYFQFIESKEELRKGKFEECHACSAGWVQEAEYMRKMAVVYDLLYEKCNTMHELHRKMEACMRHYMAFEDWRLKDGDGNNFQIAEASAALYFAILLQDQEMIKRFLEGKNGLYELMGSVLSDDGSYFEGASGYMRLAGELLGRTAAACDNVGLNLKDYLVPASYDKYVIHAAWAMRTEKAPKQMPFLGMSFERKRPVRNRTRCLKDYFDAMLRLATEEGILFSVCDSNEQNLIPLMELGYYLYRDPAYLKLFSETQAGNLLFGRHMLDEKEAKWGSYINEGNGFAILREEKAKGLQAVLKFGQHGGYHGHYDRLSLVSLIRDNKTFHNQEYAWFGYDSFLFKMWVQNSLAHNMVVVDGKMQEPSECECIYFDKKDSYSAACAQTISRWSDPPYGGQTPYLWKFPEEKCKEEGRYVLMPKTTRSQGDIGEYTDPVFQRRLLLLLCGVCIIWDFEKAEREHTYDCLYHPMGRLQKRAIPDKITSRYDRNPYGGQFIRNCCWFEKVPLAALHFVNTLKKVNFNDIIDFVKETSLFWLNSQGGQTMVGKYPEGGDNFLEEDEKAAPFENEGKKTVAFRRKGKEAEFVTVIEVGEQSSIELVKMESEESVLLKKKDGTEYHIEVRGMKKQEGKPQITVKSRKNGIDTLL